MASLVNDVGYTAAFRAVDDEDDDAFPPSYSNTVISWSQSALNELEKNSKLRCSLCLIATDPVSSAFIDAFIRDKDTVDVGYVFSGFEDEASIPVEIKSKTDKSCLLYRLVTSPDILICQCKIKIQPEQSFSWVEQICSSINCDNCEIVVLSSAFTYDFKTSIPLSDIKTPFLRALYTDRCKASLICPTLPEPNIISSLPAQILTFCQFYGIKASLYICYTDVINLDISTIKTFLPILSLPSFKSVQRNPEADIILKKLVKQDHDNSLLYL